MSSKKYKNLSKHGIVIKDIINSQYFCIFCNCSISSLYNVYQHLEGKRHQIRLKANKLDHSIKHKKQDSNDDIHNKQNGIPLNIKVPVQLSNSKRLDGTVWPEHTGNTAKYICDQCNKTIEENDIINHEIEIHKNSMKFSMKYISDWSFTVKDFNIAAYYPLFRCSFCNEIIHGILSLQAHFSKFKHEENVRLLIDIKGREYDNCKNLLIYLEPLESLTLISFENNDGTIKIKEQPIIHIKNHLKTFYKNSKTFNKNFETFNKNSETFNKNSEIFNKNSEAVNKNSIWKDFVYICVICSDIFTEAEDIINHLCETLIHLIQFKNVFSTYNYIYIASISKNLNINKTHNVKSIICRDDVSINDKVSKEYNINETQLNTEQYRDHNLMVTTDSTNDKDDTLGFFISFRIFKDLINNSPKLLTLHAESKETILDRYNKMYRKEYLDFEEIIFACNEGKLKEIKLNLQFFLPSFGKMLCLLCSDLQQDDAQAIYEHINSEKHFKNLKTIKLQENKEYFELLKELIKVERTSDVNLQRAKCYACNDNIKGTYLNASDKKDYKWHIRMPSHRNKRKLLLDSVKHILEDFQTLWYSIQYFACVKCNNRFKRKINFMEHLSVMHEAVFNKKDNSEFDFCLTCATLWYKNENVNEATYLTYQQHCKKQSHRYLKKSNDFAITSLSKPLRELLKNIEKIAADLFKSSNDVLNDPKTIQLRDTLKHIFETQLPVEVCIFGSRITGLALPKSDIDIYLDFGDECTDPELIKNRSKQIQDCLKTDHENWNIELTLDKSRTPLIKVKHRLTGLQCDISFMNSLSVENSKFIKSFNMAYPPCRKLILFLKKWILLGDLSGSKEIFGISNYALVWMVIFYLQVRFKVKSVAALIETYNQSKIVAGWETGVGDTISISIPHLPIRQLLLEFFEYYGNFDYMHLVICPLLGKTCNKRDFTEIQTIPSAMAPYVAQLQKKKPEYFRVDSCICVQDPFDLSHNLTKAVSTLTLKRFKHYCKESLSILRNVTSQKK